MIKERLTATTWTWGTQTKEQIELGISEIARIGYKCFETVKGAIYAYDFNLNAFKEVFKKYGVKPVSFYYVIPEKGQEDELFKNIDKELDFISKLGVDKICFQATKGRPEVMNDSALDYELNVLRKFGEKTREFGITASLHPHYNTWVTYKNEIDNILLNLDCKTIQFAPDTAHLVIGCCDPVDIIRTYANRVNFTHFKDIKKPPKEFKNLTKIDFSVYANFCELGTGVIDFKSIFDILKSVNYLGPICEELDSAPISNELSAKINYDFLVKNYRI